jgi:PIN domain nuclease of toxin-antitoxin system
MALYVTDTHPLVWYATEKHNRLSRRALGAFHAAAREEALIYVPAFVLWEIAMLLKVGRIALAEDYGDWAEHLIAQRGFDLAVLNVGILADAYHYPFPDPFDAVIIATARVMDLPLITKDWEIGESRLVEVWW